MKTTRFVAIAVLAPLLLATAAALTVWMVASVWATFTPEAEIILSDYNASSNADVTSNFIVPSGDVSLDSVITFHPPDWGIATDADVPDGTEVGELTSQVTLGLLNNPCNAVLNLHFDPFDSTNELTTEFADSGDIGNGTWNGYDPVCPGGQMRAICQWPGFLSELFPGVTPRARYLGVAEPLPGTKVILNFLVFEPGTSFPDHPSFPSDWGYGALTILNNPTTAAAPSPITGNCTPVVSSNTIHGTADGLAVRTNPPYGGTYLFRSWSRGARDNDGDGIENARDTCPHAQNVGDGDGDGIDDACDPDPTSPCGPGVDDDILVTDCDADGFMNRGDNCPFVIDNPADPIGPRQQDTDDDGLGDRCDPDPTTPFGDPSRPEATIEMPIGIEGPPPPAATDYGVVDLVPPVLSFANPGRFGFKVAVFYAKVQNLGAVPDGPASLSLQLDPVNPTCPAPFVLPISYSLTLAPGDQTQRAWLVLFFRCGDPSPPEDYTATAAVSAPGDSNPGNDALSATVDVRRR